MEQIEFIPFDRKNPEHFNHLLKWENDPEIQHLYIIFPDEKSYQIKQTLEGVKNRLADEEREGTRRFLILLKGKPVGQVDFTLDPPQLLKQIKGSAWIGVCIGEKEARGHGIGKESMRFAELEALKRGAVRVEIGVFEFNQHAYHMYQELAYQEFARIPNFTYWNGRMWADIRMEKMLRTS